MASDPKPAAAANRLGTFVPPAPHPWMIRAIEPVVNVACLAGIPVVREVPFLNRIPGIRGLSNVISIDLPREDELRLRASVNPATAAFLTPNHPEFFTDWMLDKAVISRIAPMCGCWATHHIVNGLGAAAQWFWLKNGLIAQVPGAGEQGKAWSIAWALGGNGVLLHPEGDVGWTSDHVGPLFPGVVDMAVSAAQAIRARHEQRPVRIAPVVWKLRFTRDVDRALQAETDYTAKRLDLLAGSGDAARRLASLYDQLLSRAEREAAYTVHAGLSYTPRQERLLIELGSRLGALTGEHPAIEPEQGDVLELWSPVLRRAERRARSLEDSKAKAATGLIRSMRKLTRFRPGLYRQPRLTQEHVAENLKRIRHDYCSGTLRDTLNHFVPQPAGPRIASVRAPEPIDVLSVLGSRSGLSEDETAALVADLRQRMQTTLDDLARTACAAAVRTYENPWLR